MLKRRDYKVILYKIEYFFNKVKMLYKNTYLSLPEMKDILPKIFKIIIMQNDIVKIEDKIKSSLLTYYFPDYFYIKFDGGRCKLDELGRLTSSAEVGGKNLLLNQRYRLTTNLRVHKFLGEKYFINDFNDIKKYLSIAEVEVKILDSMEETQRKANLKGVRRGEPIDVDTICKMRLTPAGLKNFMQYCTKYGFKTDLLNSKFYNSIFK